MGAYSRVPITWRGMRAVRAIGCLRHSRPGSIADVVKRPVVLRNRGGVSRGRDGMQKVRSPCGSADLRGTPAAPEFDQWRSAFTMCLVSASSLSWSMWAWATMTSMVENIADSSWDRVFNRVFLLGEVGDRPAGLARGACQRGCVGATLRVKQEKRRTSLAAVSGA